ncbi:hypothetical protein E9531_03280 [Lampropedia puyangensis]|uniref:DNA 3'-5' helicase II n=1 Tax=Lampropedia puyangensis TaxID=1330072 RepID=A0A4S8FAA0_9BURK|nr:3'-5' exonuclease [Lampropedia puyangensis]THU04430.1 hypothetical protein E9531_03280 [Lampropedia puyangensis]
MASEPDTENPWAATTIWGKAVAKISGRVPFVHSRKDSSKDLDHQFRQELEAISTQMPSQFLASEQPATSEAGHLIIHGVAGSGKTLMLCAHAQELAEGLRAKRSLTPILVLCYNEPLAVWLQQQLHSKGLQSWIVVRHFHRWCREQLLHFQLELPPKTLTPSAQMKDLVDRVIQGLSNGSIPTGQYSAVLVDEAHDFSGPWLAMLTHLPTPETNHLELYFDDAQSMFKRKRTSRIQFKRLGIHTHQVQRLTINHRNTAPIFNAAQRMAGPLIEPQDTPDSAIPRLKPLSSQRPGPAVLLFPMANLRAQGRKTTELLQQAHQSEGTAWGNMAVLCSNRFQMDVCNGALRYQRIPHQLRKGFGEFNPQEDTVKIMSLNACSGLEFDVVVIVDSGEPPTNEAELEEKQRQLYIAATRAKHRLYIVGLGQPESDS